MLSQIRKRKKKQIYDIKKGYIIIYRKKNKFMWRKIMRELYTYFCVYMCTIVHTHMFWKACFFESIDYRDSLSSVVENLKKCTYIHI